MPIVRVSRLDDEAVLRPIDLATWTADVSPVPRPDLSKPLLVDEQLDDVLVAEEDGVVCGYVQLSRSGPLPSQRHVLVIDGLAVDPVRQGIGLGRVLLEAAVSEARRRGARKVSLRVLAPNTRARSLYESCGFVVEGVLRGEFLLNDVYVDDMFLALYLDEAESDR